MFIELKSISQICCGGYELNLQGNILRYIDFENSSAILLQSKNTKLIFVAIGIDSNGVSKLTIIKEYDLDRFIVGFRKVIMNGQEVLNLRVGDVISLINPDTGEIIKEVATKG